MPQAETVAIPKRLPLVITPENRDATTVKDAKLVNCYSEKTLEGDYQIYKRAGVAQSTQPSGGAATGRGMFNWLGNIYSVFGNTLYKDGVAVAGTVDTTNGVYRFDSCKGGTPKLQLGNGVKAYNYDSSGGLILINDADFPTTFRKGWAYLDGTTYVLTSAATIQGSDLNDPVDWDPLNVLTAQIEPDRGIAMAKQLVYVVAMKEWSTEIFYDAGNATGSPLGTVQGAKLNYGCAHQDSVVSQDGILFWVSTNKEGSAQVVKVENLKMDIISTDPIERLLGGVDFSTETVFSFGLKVTHKFYVVTFKNANLTLAYDVDERMWTQWTDTNGNYFPFVASCVNAAGTHFLQHESDGYIYTTSLTQYSDQNSVITCDIITPNFDGGTNRIKHLNVMKFICDQVPGSILQVRKNDNDYDATKWSNFRRVDLSKKQPVLVSCGSFVRRAHHFRHQSQTAFRMRAVEMQIDLGTL